MTLLCHDVKKPPHVYVCYAFCFTPFLDVQKAQHAVVNWMNFWSFSDGIQWPMTAKLIENPIKLTFVASVKWNNNRSQKSRKNWSRNSENSMNDHHTTTFNWWQFHLVCPTRLCYARPCDFPHGGAWRATFSVIDWVELKKNPCNC